MYSLKMLLRLSGTAPFKGDANKALATRHGLYLLVNYELKD